MRVHWLQHADFEDLGCIAPWLAARGDVVTQTRLYAGEILPTPDDFDFLIVMGGPMNIYEYDIHPWLKAEKGLIKQAIAANKRVLGICLGSQLIADALGAPTTRNAHTEVGWFPVQMNATARQSKLFAGFPERYVAFHWHGDTFAIAPGARNLASSEACAHQAYDYGDRVAAIQFHLEVTAANARDWFEHERPTAAPYVQTPESILTDVSLFAHNNKLMIRLLENLTSSG
ncbi:MAG: type 1 glutamine amidotransferase [Pseudomonadota bacterium]